MRSDGCHTMPCDAFSLAHTTHVSASLARSYFTIGLPHCSITKSHCSSCFCDFFSLFWLILVAVVIAFVVCCYMHCSTESAHIDYIDFCLGWLDGIAFCCVASHFGCSKAVNDTFFCALIFVAHLYVAHMRVCLLASVVPIELVKNCIYFAESRAASHTRTKNTSENRFCWRTASIESKDDSLKENSCIEYSQKHRRTSQVARVVLCN